jgi:PKD repeat protein
VADVEGLTIYYRRNGGGYLIASSQGNDRFVVYRREGNNEYLGTFEVPEANNTDGIDVISMALGPLYPLGMFVAQNSDRDFQMVRWQDIANALGLAIDTQGYDVRGGGCLDVASVDVSPASATIVEGETVQLTATSKDAAGVSVPGCAVTWSTDTPAVAAVSSSGLVTGLADGLVAATVTATAEGVSDTSSITVTDAGATANFSFAPAAPFVGQPVAFTDASTSVDPITRQWDFGDNTPTSSLQNPLHSYAAPGTYLVTLTVVDVDGDTSTTDPKSVTVTDRPPVVLYFSLSGSATLNGVSVANEDIVAFDGTNFSLYFDGSDVGISSFAIDAIAVISPTEILMSFTSAGTVPGIAGTVDDSDIVKFTATSLGENTAGTFSMYFDGSDVGLTTSDEDVDAIELLPSGQLLVSTTGSFSVPGVSGTLSGADEDLLLFTPTSLEDVTAGTWAMYFDGSDVGLSTSSDEDVDAVAVDASGKIHLSTVGSFSVTGRSGADEDVFVFTPSSTGATTAGTFSTALFFDGSVYGLGSNDVVAIDLP